MNGKPNEPDAPKPAAIRKAILLLLPPAIGAIVGFAITRLAVTLPLVRSALSALNAWDLVGLPLAILAIIAVHESGHLLGGLARGMRFLLFVVGPLHFIRSGDGVRIDLRFDARTFGGLAACMPDGKRPLRSQLLPLIAGGPLASLILALSGLCVFGLSTGRPAAWGLITFALSSLIFLVTAWPSRSAAFMSDGAQFIEVLRGGMAVESRLRLSILMSQSISGRRPSEWDQDVIRAELGAPALDPIRRVAAIYFAFFSALDRGGDREAGALANDLAAGVEQFPSGFRQSLATELVIYHGLYRKDWEQALHWSSRCRGGIVDPARRALAEAILERDPAKRGAKLDLARRNVSRSSDPGLSRLTADQIQALENAAVAG